MYLKVVCLLLELALVLRYTMQKALQTQRFSKALRGRKLVKVTQEP